jgi:Notch-like protein
LLSGPNGFTGSLCEVQINQCASSPCINGAQCFNLVNSYVCNCKSDYYGTNCQLKQNNCASSPCRNNGTCFDQVGSFSCECPAGYFGNICQSITNNCLISNCTFGTCVNQVSCRIFFLM